MGFYLLPKTTHKNLDRIRGNFFWQGASDDFKYHMAKMDTICRPKNQGGLGMINTKHMNDSLLVKWIWKILKGPNTIWYKLLKAKYMPSGNFFSALKLEALPNFGRAYIKLNTSSNGGQFTRWEMA